MAITTARPCSFTQLTLDSEWEDIIKCLGLRSGILGDPSGSAAAASFDVPGRHIVLAPCKVVIQGRLWETDANVSTAIPAASGSDRIDRLVLRLDRAAGSAGAVVQAVVLEGTPSGSPVAPSPSYTSGGTYDVKVASWRSKSDGTLTSLTDERSFFSPGIPVCTSATRPDYFDTDGLAYESDTKSIIAWDGSAWSYLNAPPSATAYTPVFSGIGTADFSVRAGWHVNIGKMRFVNIYAKIGTAGSGSSVVTASLPTTPDRSNRQLIPFSGDGLRGTGSSVQGVAPIFSSAEGFSGAQVDRIRGSSNSTPNIDTNIIGSDLSANAFLNIQGWYLEA
jgi:hypothetical protein